MNCPYCGSQDFKDQRSGLVTCGKCGERFPESETWDAERHRVERGTTLAGDAAWLAENSVNHAERSELSMTEGKVLALLGELAIKEQDYEARIAAAEGREDHEASLALQTGYGLELSDLRCGLEQRLFAVQERQAVLLAELEEELTEAEQQALSERQGNDDLRNRPRRRHLSVVHDADASARLERDVDAITRRREEAIDNLLRGYTRAWPVPPSK